MSYELRQDETVGDGVQRVVCGQLKAAIHASGAEQNGKGSPVHETRKHLKKARSALRLAAGAVGRDTWKREDRRLAKVGKLVSEVRDAEVRLQTVRQLRQFARGRRRSFRETEELLAFELDSFLAAFSEWPEEAKQRMTLALDRIQHWPLEALRCKQMRQCVQKTYQRGREALQTAVKNRSTTKLHTFRKRAKELGYQLRILHPLAPAVFTEMTDELKTIGQYLGQVHDLAFVADRLASMGGARKRGDRILHSLVDSRERELERTAIALGERFYAERPRQFARRLSQYFAEWELTKAHCSPAPNRTTALLN